MRHFQIPESFFKTDTRSNKLYGRIWFYWLSEFVDEILEPDFLEKQKGLEKWLSPREIKEVYESGVQQLRENDFKILETKGKKKREFKPMTAEMKKEAISAIDYLNSQTGSTFSKKGNNIELVAARLREGYSLTEIKLVIDKKVIDWKGTDYSKYLRPLTLFAKSKFENYLNGTNEPNPTGKLSKLSDSVNKAQQLIKFYTER